MAGAGHPSRPSHVTLLRARACGPWSSPPLTRLDPQWGRVAATVWTLSSDTTPRCLLPCVLIRIRALQTPQVVEEPKHDRQRLACAGNVASENLPELVSSSLFADGRKDSNGSKKHKYHQHQKQCLPLTMEGNTIFFFPTLECPFLYSRK